MRNVMTSSDIKPDLPSPAAARRPRVLVVDDDPEVHRLLEVCFARVGIDCLAAETGEEGLRVAQEKPPGLILLDMMLPDLTGLEVCRRLRRLRGLDRTPVLFLTGMDDDEKAVEAYDLGAHDYLTKPFSPARLVAKVRAIVHRERETRVQTVEDIEPGDVIDDRYRVIRQIGRGGMGTVYQVEHKGLGKVVALKALRPLEEEAHLAITRFEREIAALTRIRHPNVICIHDAGLWRRIRYFTMDYVSGGTLHDRFRESPKFEVGEALRIAAEVASGLEAAHMQGVLHRDLKPANILFDAGGRAIVTDFGLLLDTVDTEQARLTEVGYLVGTPHYMSPEQIRTPTELDARSDVYSVGTLLYEMLTGRTPFLGQSSMGAMLSILQKDVLDPRDHRADLPEPVAQICLGALARDRDDRYSSAGALAEALTCAREDLGPAALRGAAS
jgi:CheY-like chemotaxis protein/tRNA A-37 threonylcarbamoyl transferase component Bud32